MRETHDLKMEQIFRNGGFVIKVQEETLELSVEDIRKNTIEGCH